MAKQTQINPQETKQRGAEDPQPEPVALSPEAKARKAALDADTDSLLDEIDDLLAVNAEEFVNSFVQQGGQ